MNVLNTILNVDKGAIFTYEREGLTVEEKDNKRAELFAMFPGAVEVVGVWDGVLEKSFWVSLKNNPLNNVIVKALSWSQDAILINDPKSGAEILPICQGENIKLNALTLITEYQALKLQGYTKIKHAGEWYFFASL